MKTKPVESRVGDNGRCSGVLVHPTSFPSPYGIGDLGDEAYNFIDFLAESGQKVWQLLPLGPTGFGDSPYQSFSSFAGQPLIISPDKLLSLDLIKKGDLLNIPKWKSELVDYGPVIIFKTNLLKIAYENFIETTNRDLIIEFKTFCEEEEFWLSDYSLFMAFKDYHKGDSWLEWDDDFKFATDEFKCLWIDKLEDEVNYYKFVQFIFFKQWYELKVYANKRNINIIGDIPIFVSPDSADVWAYKSLFRLDSKGFPIDVAGVPPDYFSATGQLWGNPLYDWQAHKDQNYKWWIERIKAQLSLVDYLRIDHFRGFEAYWSVPYGEKTAVNGKWMPGPCDDLFIAIENALGKNLPIIAEDLGVITAEVTRLRDTFNFPGMKVLQFGFDNTDENDFLPHYYSPNCICYTGTHDNDTTLGWYLTASKDAQNKVKDYMKPNGNDVSWAFIRQCIASVAKYSIVPLQDILALGSEARMNTPGVADGNWGWRYDNKALTKEIKEKLKSMVSLYGRL